MVVDLIEWLINKNLPYVIYRLIHAPYDPLTPLVPRVQTFRVNAKMAAYYHVQARTKKSSRKVTFENFFQVFFQVSWQRWISTTWITLVIWIISNESYFMTHVKLHAISHEINSDVILNLRMTLLRCILRVILIEYEFQINFEKSSMATNDQNGRIIRYMTV